MDRENKDGSLTRKPVKSSVGILQKDLNDLDVLAQDNDNKEHQTGELIDCMKTAGDYGKESVDDGNLKSADVDSRETTNVSSRESKDDDRRESTDDDRWESTDADRWESTDDDRWESTDDDRWESTDDDRRESTEDASRESTDDASRESAYDASRESAYDASRESAYDASQESACDASLESTGDANQESAGDANQESAGDANQESAGDANQESAGDANQESAGDANQESAGDANQESAGDSYQESAYDADRESAYDSRSVDNLETSFDRGSDLDHYLDILDRELEDGSYNGTYTDRWVEESTQEPNSLYNLELVEPETPNNRSNGSNESDSSGNMTSDTYRGVPYHRRLTLEGGRLSRSGVKIFGTGIAYDRGYPSQPNYKNTSPFPVQLNGTTYYNTALQAMNRNQHFGPYQIINPFNYLCFQQAHGQFQGNALSYISCFSPFNCTCASIPMPPPSFVGFGAYPRPPLPPIGRHDPSTNVPVVTRNDPRSNYPRPPLPPIGRYQSTNAPVVTLYDPRSNYPRPPLPPGGRHHQSTNVPVVTQNDLRSNYPGPPLPPIGRHHQSTNAPVVTTLYDPRFSNSSLQHGPFVGSNYVNGAPLPHFRPGPGYGWYGYRGFFSMV